MAIYFDGASKMITFSADTVTLSVADLWSRWVDWLSIDINSKWVMAMRQVGGDVIDSSAGTSIPVYIYLTNGWRLRPKESDHTLNVFGGILLVEGGGDPFVNTIGSYNVRINYSQPVQAITVSTGGGLAPTANENASAVLDKLLSEHQIVGSTGKALSTVFDKTQHIQDTGFVATTSEVFTASQL